MSVCGAGRYSSMSPGWQSRISQMLVRVEKRMALAFPVLRIDRLEGVISIRDASSPSDIFRLAIITSRFIIIGTVKGGFIMYGLYCQFVVFLKLYASGPYLGHEKRHEAEDAGGPWYQPVRRERIAFELEVEAGEHAVVDDA